MSKQCAVFLKSVGEFVVFISIGAFVVWSIGDWSDEANPQDHFKVGQCVTKNSGTPYKIHNITKRHLLMVYKEEGDIRTVKYRAYTEKRIEDYDFIKCSIVGLDDVKVGE